MKFGFITCVQLGKSCIEKILEMGGRLDLLVTLKDEKAKDKSGRIYLDDIATKNNIPLLKINNVNDIEVIEILKKYEIDWLFIIGWSQIAKIDLLNTPKKGCIGMHPTLLPEGRGRASIPWAILKKLDKTGVTMFKLNQGVDTGEILGQVEIPLTEEITATELYREVNKSHIKLIEKYWEDIINDRLELKEQQEEDATYWEGRKPEDGEIKNKMTVEEAETLVRAVTHPYPGAFYKKDNQKIIIWKAKKVEKYEENSIELLNGYLLPIEYTVETIGE
ncbi:Polymyxin resistance protein PmrI [Fusobacterium necrogenes]|uniref:Polymyxin resistance protein PmrI n=1 Tax=Fusobacterium necrogenes TaxID=858 RepID=A0A377H0E1_9FUSO|nr:formyltransferase family protein [Fusobacterium necrogenes]STO32261.1 Polymyxin resistance protein PmrI [Fusobacterium necrogenes]